MRRFIGLVALALILAQAAIFAPSGEAQSGTITVQDLASGQSAQGLVNCLLSTQPGVTVSNIQYTGSNRAGGTFSASSSSILGFSSGVVLSTGKAAAVVGPNTSDGGLGPADNINGTGGDSDLALLAGGGTSDASILQFNFVPTASQLTFRYVFASEEYREYVGSQFNDRFGLFVNNQNVALLPDHTTPVAINTVNHLSNSSYYRDNQRIPNTSNSAINTQMDGLTVVFTATTNVNVGQVNRIKLAIADAGDSNLDSNVFFECGSFSVIPVATATPDGTTATPGGPTPAGPTPTLSIFTLGTPVATATPAATETAEPERDPQPRKLTREQKQQLQRTDTSSLDDTHIEGDVIAVNTIKDPPELVIGNLDGLATLRMHDDAAEIARYAKPGDYFVGKGEKNTEQDYDIYSGDLKHKH